MLSCINKSSVEYQSLKERANIPEPILEAVCRQFVTKYDRFPHLDELPHSNSEAHLRQKLQTSQYNGTKIDHILEVTSTDNLIDANIQLNQEYSDLETWLIPLNKEAIVDIKHRPTEFNFDQISQYTQDTEVNGREVIGSAINKLRDLYGIKLNTITDAELNTEQWGQIVDPVNAFVHNSQIYVNVDRASADAPIHEMMHILIGSVRFSNPKLYQDLVDSAMNFPNYNRLAQDYYNKSQNDLNEEIFVSEAAKYFAGQKSNLSNMSNKVRYELEYNMKRLLDTILMGDHSVKTISNIYNKSLLELATLVNSDALINKFHGTINVEGSELHRVLNNTKSDLLKEGTLKEICE